MDFAIPAAAEELIAAVPVENTATAATAAGVTLLPASPPPAIGAVVAIALLSLLSGVALIPVAEGTPAGFVRNDLILL